MSEFLTWGEELHQRYQRYQPRPFVAPDSRWMRSLIATASMPWTVAIDGKKRFSNCRTWIPTASWTGRFFFPGFYGPGVRYKVTILIPTSNTSRSALSTSMPGAGGEGTTWNQGLRRNVFAYSFLALPYVASLVKYPWLLHVTEVIVKKYWDGLWWIVRFHY